MKLRRWLLIAVALLAKEFPGAPAHAQDTLSAAELLRTRYVRIAAPALAPGWLTGHLVYVDTVTFTIQTVRPEPWQVPKVEITSIQIGVGRGRTESILRSMGIGALVGAGSLLAYEALIYGKNEMFGFVAVVLGLPLGGLAGAVAGSFQDDLEWVDVEVHTPQ